MNPEIGLAIAVKIEWIAEQEIKKIKNGRFVLLPISEKTHGHGTHTDAAVWQEYLKELLDKSQH